MARTNLIDERVEVKEEIDEDIQQFAPKIDTTRDAMKRFSTSHNTENIEKVYSDLNVGQFFETRDKLAKVQEPEAKPNILNQEKRKPMKNPFESKPTPQKRTTYNDIVDIPTVAPTLEVKNYADMPIKPIKNSSGKRFRLWLVTGICCLIMLGGAITLSTLNIGQTAGSNATITEVAVEQGALADESGYINNTGTNMNGENIGAMEKVSGVNKPVVKPQPSTSLWDKVCAFFSRIFGG